LNYGQSYRDLFLENSADPLYLCCQSPNAKLVTERAFGTVIGNVGLSQKGHNEDVVLDAKCSDRLMSNRDAAQRVVATKENRVSGLIEPEFTLNTRLAAVTNAVIVSAARSVVLDQSAGEPNYSPGGFLLINFD
jgi:hypothetical protein